MKKWIVVALAVFVFQKWHVVESYINPLPEYGAAHKVDVIMYGTDWCGVCKVSRQFMDENGISYYEYDIEKSTEGERQYESLGGNGVPLMLINGMMIRGFDPEKILALAKGSDGLLGRLGF